VVKMREKCKSVKRFGRFPPNYSFADYDLNCELHVEKLAELTKALASGDYSIICGLDDYHRFIHTLH
jgi:hypothetical protein